MARSSRKPVVRVGKRHPLNLGKKRVRGDDAYEKEKKEADDAWKKYDEHMREQHLREKIIGLSYFGGRRIKQPNYALQYQRLKAMDDEDAQKRGFKNYDEWEKSPEFKAERAAKQKKWQEKNARAIRKVKKKGEHSGRLTRNKAGTVVSVGKRTRDERNEKVKGLFKNAPKLKRKSEGIKNYAHEKGTSVPSTIKRLKDMFKEAIDNRRSIEEGCGIEADTSKKQETWKMHPELRAAIKKALKATRAQITTVYGKPITPGKHSGSMMHEAHSRNQLRQALNYHSDAEDFYDREDDEKKQARHSQARRTIEKMLDKNMWKKEKNWTDLSDDKVYGRQRRRNNPRHKLKMTIKKAKRKKASSR